MKARLVTGEIEIYRRQRVSVSIFAKKKKQRGCKFLSTRAISHGGN